MYVLLSQSPMQIVWLFEVASQATLSEFLLLIDVVATMGATKRVCCKRNIG